MEQIKSPFIVPEYYCDQDIYVPDVDGLQREIRIRPMPGEVPTFSTGFWNSFAKMVGVILLICGAWWGWRLFW